MPTALTPIKKKLTPINSNKYVHTIEMCFIFKVMIRPINATTAYTNLLHTQPQNEYFSSGATL